jgi:cobalamin biosynthesis Mg chelatase CobN
VSNFRIICVAALASPLLLIAGAAIAQSVTDQSGKPLAGLRPPHEHHKLARAKTGPAKSQHNATAKVARKPAKRRSIVAASSTAEVPRRVAKNNSHIVNSRITNSPITWPSAEPAAAEESSTPQTALQFATEDTASNTAPATATATATTAKAKTVATDERKDPAAVDMRPTASKLVQTERFEAPAASQISSQAPTETPSQMPSQAPGPASNQAPTQTLVAAPARQEMTTASRASSSTSILVTLAGAITAGLVGWLMFGFGAARTIRVSREPAAPIQYLPFVPLR